MGAPTKISLDEDASPIAKRRTRLAFDVDRFLNLFVVRLLLSAAIIISLMPLDWGLPLDLFFLAVFFAEVVGRAFVLYVRGADGTDAHRDAYDDDGERRRSRAGAVVLLVVDVVALVSFVPLPVSWAGTRWLRLFRLTRMLLLVGYWAPLVRDVWAVLARRERVRQIVLMGFVVAGLSFAGAVFLHYVGGTEVDANGDDSIDARDREFAVMLWWAFRQVQDPGNIVASPNALPLLLTSVALTVFGLFLVSFLIGLGTDVVHELLERMQLRPPGLRGHTVIVNIAPSTRRLLHELMRYYRSLLPTEARVFSVRWFSDLRRRGLTGPKYLVVGRGEEPPDFLRQPALSSIVYRQRSEEDEMLIARADLLAAKRILLLADPDEPSPDAATIKTLLTFVERIAERERDNPSLTRFERRRVIIAEILDESNVAAARAAVRTGTSSFRAFVVPTERLLALFIAGIVRRPGMGTLLAELLSLRGHELYTCFFQNDGLGFVLERPPDLGSDYSAAMRRLLVEGLARSDEGEPTVIPVGLLTAGEGTSEIRDFEVVVNPDGPGDGDEVIGFVALADGFRSVSEFAEALAEDRTRAERPAEPARPLPEFRSAAKTEISQVLLCGFRPGSIYMIEELLRGQVGGRLLVLVDDAAEARAVHAVLESHTALVAAGLMPARHGMFEPLQKGSYRFYCPGDPPEECSTVHVVAADWMESRHLVDLPHPDFGHVKELDAIVFVAEEDGSADAKTTAALLKLEALFSDPSVPQGRPRVVAEVFDTRLAARLQAHCAKVGRHHVRIYSIQALRAFFLFQSVVVPGCDRVYSALLGSWGQSFVRFEPVEPGRGRCTFGDLALSFMERHCIVVAVEIAGEDGEVTLSVAPGKGELGLVFDLADLQGVWTIAPDHVEASLAAPSDPTPRASPSVAPLGA